MTAQVPWLAEFALRRGMRYRPEVDERWVRVWEPFATLKTPIRYEHALESTGEVGSLTIARFTVGGSDAPESTSWIVVAQDVRIAARAAATCDFGSRFAEALDTIAIPRRATGDAAFDHVFASFAPTPEELARAITPSLRKLVLGWRLPLHVELRPGGFILAPVSLAADANALSWLVRAVHFFGDKAAKAVPEPR